MPDFTLITYRKLLSTLNDSNYIFQSFKDFLENPAKRIIILRHDVDARNKSSLKTAQIENEMGIRGTYYFRMVPGSYDEQIIKQIHDLGHEIGYHYEDLSRCAVEIGKWGLSGLGQLKGSKKTRVPGQRAKGGGETQKTRIEVCKTARIKSKFSIEKELVDLAMVSFRKNLEKLRRVVPVETICMHGSPLSKWDNKLLWKYYDYKALGIAAEPYFDIDFNDVLYLTDTGRRWDGGSVSVRDKIPSLNHGITPDNKISDRLLKFKSTFDIIRAAGEGSLPDKIMITIHPQRWTNDPGLWLWEMISQKVKNSVKYFIASRQSPV